MNLLQYIRVKLNADHRFHYLGRGNNLGAWSTRPRGETNACYIELFKPMGGKLAGRVDIILYEHVDGEVSLTIQIELPSYCETYTFFEGWVETTHDYNRLLVMCGLAKSTPPVVTYTKITTSDY